MNKISIAIGFIAIVALIGVFWLWNNKEEIAVQATKEIVKEEIIDKKDEYIDAACNSKTLNKLKTNLSEKLNNKINEKCDQ